MKTLLKVIEAIAMGLLLGSMLLCGLALIPCVLMTLIFRDILNS